MVETENLAPVIVAPSPVAEDLYEIVNGQVVELLPMGAYETIFATKLSKLIHYHFARAGEPGLMALETLFRIREEPNLQRRPDLAFVSYEQWPRDLPVPRESAWQIVPDLAIEIISPNDFASEVLEKLDEYFQAGVRQVWVVFPRQNRLFIYDGPKRITVLDAGDTLDGGAILPGFRLPLAELFDKATGSGA